MQQKVVIDGDIELRHTLDGDIELNSTIDGEAGLFMPVFPDNYDGPLDITPTDQQQILNTINLTMPGNVIIEPIPSNYGLITWVDGHIRVS